MLPFLGVLVALLAVALGTLLMVLWGGSGDDTRPYVQQQLASRLTTRRAGMLSVAQIRGEQPLTVGGTRPIAIRDIKLSLRHDIDALHAMGLCAMHYDFGVSACMVRKLGADSYVMLYNMNVTGWRAHKLINWETSTLCDGGKQRYQVERFDMVWIRYLGDDGRVYDRWFDDPDARAVQHLAALNRGMLPCQALGIEEVASRMREAAMMRDL